VTALLTATGIPPALVSGRRIGLFGGSFNPPHAGHLAVAEEALRRLRLHEVWWLVATRNPLKDPGDVTDLERRLRLARKMAGRNPRFRVLDLERRTGTYYTADLLDALGPQLDEGLFVWIMGADSFATLHSWGRWRSIPWRIPLAVFDRPEWGLRALRGPAAVILRQYRVPEREAVLLPELEPPAWSFLRMPLRPESSTCIRHPEACPDSTCGSSGHAA